MRYSSRTSYPKVTWKMYVAFLGPPPRQSKRCHPSHQSPSRHSCLAPHVVVVGQDVCMEYYEFTQRIPLPRHRAFLPGHAPLDLLSIGIGFIHGFSRGARSCYIRDVIERPPPLCTLVVKRSPLAFAPVCRAPGDHEAALPRTNPSRSILQGCPISVVLISLLMTVWIHWAVLPVGTLTGIYIDDRHIWAIGPNAEKR